MAKTKHYYIRKTHRWLGLLLGIQFTLWTVGGLYFSWSNIDEVHGDFQKKSAPLLSASTPLVSPAAVLETIQKNSLIDSIISLQLVNIMGKPFYQVKCSIGTHDSNRLYHMTNTANFLANASTGSLRAPLTQEEAIIVARSRFNAEARVKSIEYLTHTNNHHEYRESPLPAYAISFEHPTNTTVYVASELGTVQKFRNDKWRIFDFLWMMHTMDYQGRDDFSNILLRIFSICGLITVLSGFALYFASSRRFKRKSISKNI